MKKISALLLIFALILSVKNFAQAEEKSADKWLIYWYICGTDLERLQGYRATEDLEEMTNLKFKPEPSADGAEIDESAKVQFPRSIPSEEFRLSPNVKVLIQTGGAQAWRNADIPSNTIGRYIFDSDGFHYQGSFKDSDMGDAKTLEDFLRYGKDTVEKDFQPTRRMFIFWNHGGLVRVCFDERYDGESLDLNEIYQVFKKVYKAAPNNPPFEIIGFDACTRATYENANNLYGFARYMVASEENESLNGWYYSDWIKALSENPSMSAKNLGAIICQSSYSYMIETNHPQAVEATFSVLDLSPEKWLPLRKAYNSFNKNYFKAASKNPYIYTALDVAAHEATPYNSGYEDGIFYPGLMLDLKDFAERAKDNFPNDIDSSTRKRLTKSADDLILAIDSAVVYNVYGDLRAGSNGISTHYPLSKNNNEFELYASQNVVFKYTRELYGNLVGMAAQSNNGAADNENSRSKRSKSSTRNWNEIFDLSDLFNLEVAVNENYDDTYEISAELTKDQIKKISSIQSSTWLSIEEGGNSTFGISGEGGVMLGTSSNVRIEPNGDNYRLSNTLKPTWPSLNGHLIYAEVMEMRNDTRDANGKVIRQGYTIYGVPIMLNDTTCLLRVAYYPVEQRYQIIGARPSETRGVGRTTREFFTLKKGDKIAPIFMAVIPAEDSDVPDAEIMHITVGDIQAKFVATVGESFTLDEDPVVSEKPLGDSENYVYQFLFYSPRGNRINSKSVKFEIFDGEIFDAEKHEPSFEEDTQVKFIENDEEYTVDPKTGKIYKDGEEYIRDMRTGELVKVGK